MKTYHSQSLYTYQQYETENRKLIEYVTNWTKQYIIVSTRKITYLIKRLSVNFR